MVFNVALVGHLDHGNTLFLHPEWDLPLCFHSRLDWTNQQDGQFYGCVHLLNSQELSFPPSFYKSSDHCWNIRSMQHCALLSLLLPHLCLWVSSYCSTFSLSTPISQDHTLSASPQLIFLHQFKPVFTLFHHLEKILLPFILYSRKQIQKITTISQDTTLLASEQKQEFMIPFFQLLFHCSFRKYLLSICLCYTYRRFKDEYETFTERRSLSDGKCVNRSR